MKIGVVCYPTFGGSGVLATELGMGLARRGHEVHFITYRRPARLGVFQANVFYHEVDSGADYPLFEFAPYETSMASKLAFPTSLTSPSCESATLSAARRSARGTLARGELA